MAGRASSPWIAATAALIAGAVLVDVGRRALGAASEASLDGVANIRDN